MIFLTKTGQSTLKVGSNLLRALEKQPEIRINVYRKSSTSSQTANRGLSANLQHLLTPGNPAQRSQNTGLKMFANNSLIRADAVDTQHNRVLIGVWKLLDNPGSFGVLHQDCWKHVKAFQLLWVTRAEVQTFDDLSLLLLAWCSVSTFGGCKPRPGYV
jgi:hypothetical protein